MSESNRTSYQVRSSAQKFETREAEGKLYISGYFAVFNSEIEIFPADRESVAPGA